MRVLLFLLFLVPLCSNACGTIETWTRSYKLADSDEDRLNALKFIHCDVIVEAYLNDAPIEDVSKLYEMLNDAIRRVDEGKWQDKAAAEYARNLVLKNYMRFRLFEKHNNRNRYGIEGLFVELYGVSQEEFVAWVNSRDEKDPIFSDEHMSEGAEGYARVLTHEVAQLNSKR